MLYGLKVKLMEVENHRFWQQNVQKTGNQPKPICEQCDSCSQYSQSLCR